MPTPPPSTSPPDAGLPGRMRIILHGGHADDEWVRESVERLRAAGWDVDVRLTWEGGHARAFAAEAAGDYDVVVAAGGDGTVGEVAAGLGLDGGEGRAALGVLPLGTANDFASSAGIPTDELDDALALITGGARRTIDLATCGERGFVNVATGGFGAQVTAETPDGLKNALGGLSYLLAGVGRIRSVEAQQGTIRGPDFEWSGAFLALAVGNGCQTGGGTVLCPGALLDDGLLDVRIVPEGDGAGRLLLEALVKDRETVLDESSLAFRGPWVEVETSEPMHVNLDGEPLEGTFFRFEVHPGALTCLLPPDSALLSG